MRGFAESGKEVRAEAKAESWTEEEDEEEEEEEEEQEAGASNWKDDDGEEGLIFVCRCVWVAVVSREMWGVERDGRERGEGERGKRRFPSWLGEAVS